MTTTLPLAEPPPVAGGRADVVGGGCLLVVAGGVVRAAGVTVTVLVTTGLGRVVAAVLGCPLRVFEAPLGAEGDGVPGNGSVVGEGATTVIAVCRVGAGAEDATGSAGSVRADEPDPDVDDAVSVAGVGAAS
jgi:hypothetical protein